MQVLISYTLDGIRHSAGSREFDGLYLRKVRIPHHVLDEIEERLREGETCGDVDPQDSCSNYHFEVEASE